MCGRKKKGKGRLHWKENSSEYTFYVHTTLEASIIIPTWQIREQRHKAVNQLIQSPLSNSLQGSSKPGSWASGPVLLATTFMALASIKSSTLAQTIIVLNKSNSSLLMSSIQSQTGRWCMPSNNIFTFKRSIKPQRKSGFRKRFSPIRVF